MKRGVDADTAAKLLGTLTANPIGTGRGFVEAAIALAAPAQRALGRIADGEVPEDPETLRVARRDISLAQQLLDTAKKTLDEIIDGGPRPTSPGGAA